VDDAAALGTHPPPWHHLRPKRGLSTATTHTPATPLPTNSPTKPPTTADTIAIHTTTPRESGNSPGFRRSLLGWRQPTDRLFPQPVRVGGRYRPLQSGGGLQCPGRFDPNHRPPARLRFLTKTLIEELVRPYYRPEEPTNRRSLIDDYQRGAKLGFTVNGKKGVCPFPADQIHRARQAVSRTLHEKGFPHALDQTPRQPFYLDLVSAMATANRDSEAQLTRRIRRDGGVPLGVDEVLEDIPEHYPADKPELDPELDPPWNPDMENYSSAALHIDELLKTYSEEVHEGMCTGPFNTYDDLVTYLGGQTPVMVPLGGKQERTKVRAIHDGSAPGTNARIQRNCRTRIQLPGIQDARQMSAVAHQRGVRLGLLQLDYARAHRRVPLLPKDWKYLCIKLLDGYWCNHVGTYGVASAQFYWGRVAGLLHRIGYNLQTTPDLQTYDQIRNFFWSLLYVDDVIIYMSL